MGFVRFYYLCMGWHIYRHRDFIHVYILGSYLGSPVNEHHDASVHGNCIIHLKYQKSSLTLSYENYSSQSMEIDSSNFAVHRASNAVPSKIQPHGN